MFKQSNLLSTGFVRLSCNTPSAPAVQESTEIPGNEQSSSSLSPARTDNPVQVAIPSKPNQPYDDYRFPKKKFWDNYHSFKPSWTKQFSWLHYNESNDSVFCWYCMKAVESGKLKSSKREDSFTTQGFSNWKNATTAFRKHEIRKQLISTLFLSNVKILHSLCRGH